MNGLNGLINKIVIAICNGDCTNGIPDAKNVRIHVGSMDVIADVGISSSC